MKNEMKPFDLRVTKEMALATQAMAKKLESKERLFPHIEPINPATLPMLYKTPQPAWPLSN